MSTADLGSAALVIGPPTPWTFVGGTQAFVANEPVSWSVAGDAAPISVDGVFSAPTTPGTFTVRATSIAAPSQQATTTITVRAAPFAMTSDGGGKLYVSEVNGEYTVREIDVATGAVRTIVGFDDSDYIDAVGAEARFCAPTGLAAVGGYLYVSDWSCPTIRRVDIATGEVRTIAGNGDSGTRDGIGTDARLYIPVQLATDGASTRWVADYRAVRKVDVALGSPSYGQVTTIASDNNGPSPFGQLRGIAWQGPAPGALYVADSGSGTRRISKITDLGAATPTVVAAWAGDGTAGTTDSPLRMQIPTALALGPTRLFFTDWNAERAVDIASDGSAGAAVTLAGAVATASYLDGTGGAARFDDARGLAVVGNTVYVADNDNQVIRAVDVSTQEVTTVLGRVPTFVTAASDGTGADATFLYPYSVVHAGGSIAYVADRRTIRRVDFATGEVTTPFGDRAATGTTDGNGNAARFTGLNGIVLVGRVIYAADGTNHNLRAIDLDTNEVTTFAGDVLGQQGYADGVGTDARFSSPLGIVSDGSALYVMTARSTLRRIDLASRQVVTVAGSPDSNIVVDGVGSEALLGRVHGLAFEEGRIWFGSSNCLRMFEPDTRRVTTVVGCARDYGDGSGTVAGIGDVGALMASDGAGHVYFGDPANGSLRRYDIAWGTVSTIVGRRGQRGLRPLALPSTVNTPMELAIVGANDFLLTDADEHALIRIH